MNNHLNCCEDAIAHSSKSIPKAPESASHTKVKNNDSAHSGEDQKAGNSKSKHNGVNKNYSFLLIQNPGVKSNGSSGKPSHDTKAPENKHSTGN